MCEQGVMPKPSFTSLVEATGISRGYASDILRGEQAPSRPLAVHIYRKTGWKHGRIADLTDAQIDMLEAIEPWAPAKQDAA